MDPPEPPETAEQKRARLLAELDAAVAESKPDPGDDWQYPPAPFRNDQTPAPSLSWGVLILLGTVATVVVIAAVGAFG